MQKLIDLFSELPSSYRSLILIFGLMFFWFVEGVLPLQKIRYPKIKHAALNIFFTVTTVAVNFCFAALLYKASYFVGKYNVGLYNLLPVPFWLKIIIAFLVLDLIGAYFIHWLQHKVAFMWRFHTIHHTDAFVDATTANRHHPGESLFRAIFTGIAIIASGAPFGLVILYQSASALLSQFNHANIVLPKWLNTCLGWLIVMPNVHKVHHHYKQPFTDSNYGNIFIVWDKLFATYISFKKVENQLHYGLDTHTNPKTETISNLLALPFKKNKLY
jgi:sterol desaturase/sphingolipid hydroxylase (fatty acid hydroxylase superfamily)